MTDWLQPFMRTFPSANMALVRGVRPILIDSGFGSDVTETLTLLQSAGIQPDDLQMVANTHYHCDHVGGNHVLQQNFGIPIAAHMWEAQMINRRDREACSAEWLNQSIEPYQVTHLLKDGDEISTGEITLRVLHTPGHTLGHVCYFAEHDGTLICGDAFHADDVAWLNVFREGAGALDRMLESLEKLLSLPLKRAFSGHSAMTDQPHTAIRAAIDRYLKWSRSPEKIGWHACKRIFTYALMLTDGLTESEIAPYLMRCPWFLDYSRYVFSVEPADFVQPLVDELLRSGAAVWRNDKLVPTAPYNPPASQWLNQIKPPSSW